MEKSDSDESVFKAATDVVAQVDTLLYSTANPSDATSLSIRLSMIKVNQREEEKKLSDNFVSEVW